MNLGLMQDFELTIPSILEHAAQNHGDTEIVARMVDGTIHRYNYREMANRSRQLAGSLSRVGVKYGDMVGTLAWNNHWHMECFYGIPGIGAVCHTVNPRLFKDQIIYIINHANDKILMVDMDFVDLAEDICDDIPNIETFVILGRKGDITHPQKLKNVLYYENLIETESTNFEWSELEEKTASGLCYTSGTTGNPKGVLYSHRSTILHSMAIAQPDNLSLSAADCVMPVAPLYHAQSWGLPYGAAMVGAKFVLPGNRLDGPNLLELIHREKVTTGCGVPTIWTSVLEHAETMGEDLNPLERLLIGGTALPTIIRDKMKKHGVNPVQIWGMTETSPLGTIGRPNRKVIDTMDESETAQQMLKQGRLPYGVQMKVVLADGAIAPHDGETSGDLWVKGPWIASAYLNHDKDLLDAEGFFPTGDVGCIDSYGYMRITDRSKDVIKSGGEWISSIDIEDIANSHPKVSLAAVVASYHSKWDERPLLFIKLRDDESMEKQEMFDYLIGKIAKWWTPDDVLFIEEMPLTATGKIRKLDLREKFWNHLEA